MNKKLKVYLQASDSTADLSALPNDSLIFGNDGTISIKENDELKKYSRTITVSNEEPTEEDGKNDDLWFVTE